LFLVIYHAIVLAEENFLANKFGASYSAYCKRVNRWVPSLKGIGRTFQGATFKAKRWVLKEYNTQYVWLSGIALILLFRYPQLTDFNTDRRTLALAIVLPILLALYLLIRFLKKSGRMTEE